MNNNNIDEKIEQLVAESLKPLYNKIYNLKVMLFLSTIINVIYFSTIILQLQW